MKFFPCNLTYKINLVSLTNPLECLFLPDQTKIRVSFWEVNYLLTKLSPFNINSVFLNNRKKHFLKIANTGNFLDKTRNLFFREII